MSLIDDRKSGYTAQAINAAPIYPGAAWAHKFVIEANDLTGFVFEIYARETVRSSTRCFNIDFTVADEDGKKVLYPLAVNTTTKKAFLNKTVFVTCQFTEAATGNTYIAFEGAVAVGAGSLSGIIEVPTIPGIVTVSDGDYGDILVTGSGLNWAVKESAVTQHRAALNIPEPIAIANDLVTNEAAQALSAAQGVVLNGYIDALNTLVASDDVSLDTLQEIVDFIGINKATLDTLGISNIAGLQSALDSKATAAQGALADSALQAGNNFSDLGDLPTAKANLNYLASEIPTNTANFSENLTTSEANLQLALDKLSKTRKSLSVGYNVVFSDTLGTDWLGHQNNGRFNVNSNAGGGTNPVLDNGLTSFGAINAGSESGTITFDFAYSVGSFDFIEICAMIIDRVTLIETFIKKTINVTAGGRQYEEFDLSSYSALNNSSIYIFYRATTAPAASESFNTSVSLI